MMKSISQSKIECATGAQKTMVHPSRMAIRGTPVPSSMAHSHRVKSSSRRMSMRTQSVAEAVKPSSPSKKGDAMSAEVAKELYEDMVLGREFEEMCAQMYYRGKMFGFVHLYSGQEAVSTGRETFLLSVSLCLFSSS